MGDHFNNQHIPNSNLRNANSWTALENRQAQGKEVAEKLRKKTKRDYEDRIDSVDKSSSDSNISSRLEDAFNMGEYD